MFQYTQRIDYLLFISYRGGRYLCIYQNIFILHDITMNITKNKLKIIKLL